MNELVSIIIPCYNVEKYIEECLESIQNQTYSNIEIICVDDGSKDKTTRLIAEMQKTDTRIKLHSTNRKYAGGARNKGLNIASGKYITFIDSDDVVSEKYIEYLYELLKDSNASISTCDIEFFYTEPEKNNIQEELKEYTNKKEIFKDLFLFKNITNSVTCKLFCREIFDDLRFKEEVIYEDINIIADILERADKIVCSKKQLYYYRQRETSIMHTKFDERNIFIYEVFHRLSKFAIKYDSWKEFNYYQLKTMIDTYKLLIFSDYKDVELERKTRNIINISADETKKEYIGKREKILIYLINMPVSAYKFGINIHQKIKEKG